MPPTCQTPPSPPSPRWSPLSYISLLSPGPSHPQALGFFLHDDPLPPWGFASVPGIHDERTWGKTAARSTGITNRQAWRGEKGCSYRPTMASAASSLWHKWPVRHLQPGFWCWQRSLPLRAKESSRRSLGACLIPFRQPCCTLSRFISRIAVH